MNSADYFTGCLALLLTVAPWVFASCRLRRRLLPEWTGAVSGLVAAVLGISGILIVAELLGIADLLSRWPMAAASALVALAAGLLAGRSTGGAPAVSPEPAKPQRAALALAALCVLGLSAALLGRDARVLHTGPDDLDSVHYHLTEAAYFAQSHDIDHLHQTGASDFTTYFPYDDELLDAVGMLGPKPDIAILPVNLGFAWLALLACWVIGARWQMAAASVAAGASVLALPLLAGASSGPGLNDIPALAPLLAAVAVAAHADGRPQRWLTASAVAGLALGLAAGAKLSLLAPVVIVALGFVVIAPARRALTAAVVAGAALLTGGFWFLRDWVAVGTPLPNLNLTIDGHGLHGVPYPHLQPEAFTVAHYLTNRAVIRHYYVPDLKIVFTPLWPLVLLLALAGILLALVRRGSRLRRTLALAALIGLAVYVLTPTTALGPPGKPILFGSDLRYATPMICLGMVLLATAEPLRRFAIPVTAGFTVLTFALLGSSTTARYVDRTLGWAAAAAVAAALAWGAAALARRPAPRLLAAITVTGLVVAVGGGAVVQREYLRARYAGTDPLDRLYAWAATVHGQRIGVAGRPLQYPLFGPTLDNQVKYVGVLAADRSFAAPTTCRGWQSALAAGRYRYVVIEPLRAEHTSSLLAWTVTLRGAHVVMRDSAGTVVSLPRGLRVGGCHRHPTRSA